MRIDSPIFSGSISQGDNSYTNLSGSFTGSFLGSDGTFDVISVVESIDVGSGLNSIVASGSVLVTGSVSIVDGDFLVDGVNVLDSAIAFSIALG